MQHSEHHDSDMKRIILYTILVMALPVSLTAQNMSDIIKDMPDSIMPLLTKNDRLDFIDYLASNMKAEVTNRLGGKSEMTTISNDYAHIRMTGSSEISFKLLPTISDTIICMIHTHTSNVSDSKITFFNKKWEVLTSDNYFEKPSADKFISLPDTLTNTEKENLRNKVYIPFIKAENSKDNLELKFTLTTSKYMNTDDSKAIVPYIKSEITMKWNGQRFE